MTKRAVDEGNGILLEEGEKGREEK